MRSFNPEHLIRRLHINSTLGPETGYAHLSVRGFPQQPLANYGIVPKLRPWPLPSTSTPYPIQYPLFIGQSDITQLLKSSLNIWSRIYKTKKQRRITGTRVTMDQMGATTSSWKSERNSKCKELTDSVTQLHDLKFSRWINVLKPSRTTSRVKAEFQRSPPSPSSVSMSTRLIAQEDFSMVLYFTRRKVTLTYKMLISVLNIILLDKDSHLEFSIIGFRNMIPGTKLTPQSSALLEKPLVAQLRKNF
jgi:hypothetical protein